MIGINKIYFILLSLTFILSCKNESIHFNEVIIQDDAVNKLFVSGFDESEKALVSGYLFAYGNECSDTSSNIKAQILDVLNIKNECDSTHLNFLKGWFKNDVMMSYKLNNCPILPFDSAIQNNIKELNLERHNDTLTISILVFGLNNSQEKNWNSKQTERFLIDNNTFIKI